MNKDFKNHNSEPKVILGRLLAVLFKGILLGVLKALIFIIYFSARIAETVSHFIAEQLKPHINYDR